MPKDGTGEGDQEWVKILGKPGNDDVQNWKPEEPDRKESFLSL
jgi:hypothetical protein